MLTNITSKALQSSESARRICRNLRKRGVGIQVFLITNESVRNEAPIQGEKQGRENLPDNTYRPGHLTHLEKTKILKRQLTQYTESVDQFWSKSNTLTLKGLIKAELPSLSSLSWVGTLLWTGKEPNTVIGHIFNAELIRLQSNPTHGRARMFYSEDRLEGIGRDAVISYLSSNEVDTIYMVYYDKVSGRVHGQKVR